MKLKSLLSRPGQAVQVITTSPESRRNENGDEVGAGEEFVGKAVAWDGFRYSLLLNWFFLLYVSVTNGFGPLFYFHFGL